MVVSSLTAVLLVVLGVGVTLTARRVGILVGGTLLGSGTALLLTTVLVLAAIIRDTLEE